MPKVVLVYRGWIGAKESDRQELEKLGVEVDGWDPIGAFNRCSMPASVHAKFIHAWSGRYGWGLIPRREEVYTNEELLDDDIPF